MKIIPMPDTRVSTLSVDALLADPRKAAMLEPERAQELLIAMTAILPLLCQRSLVQIGPEGDPLLTIRQVAQLLQVSEYRAYELARQGTVKSIHVGRKVRVRKSDLTAFLAQSTG